MQETKHVKFPGIPVIVPIMPHARMHKPAPMERQQINPEFPFLNLVQTLIIGPQPQRGIIAQDFDFGAEPPTRFMKAILGALGEDPRLMKLIISGDALSK